MGTQENRPSGFVRFKVTGETSSSGYKARDIYPEHVREAINKRSASLNQGKAPKPKESTAAEHAANAASLQAQLEELRKQQEALLAKKRPGDSASSALPPPSAFTATKPRR